MRTQQKDRALAMNELTGARVGSANVSANPVGLYVHVPFCASSCDFCAFYQIKPDAEKIARYFSGLADEVRLISWSRPISTIFWGGGTPGLLSPDQLRRLGEIVRALPRLEASIEWSVEMAPASVTEARLLALKEIGVTRISIGVQSLRPALLEGLGRQHTREQALRAYERVRSVGFQSVNLDLMFALPGQDEALWLEDLHEAMDLKPDHLSTYCLTFEEDTALWVKLSQGKVKLDPTREAQLYETTWAELARSGFEQYEVSNFARPGHACRHNLNTWAMHEWIGLGPSAASQFEGVRGSNPSDLARWSEGVAKGERATDDRTLLSPASLLEDALIFGLRMNVGVDLATLRERFRPTLGEFTSVWAEVERRVLQLVEDGLAQRERNRLFLTPRGRLLADAVGAEIMGSFQSSESL